MLLLVIFTIIICAVGYNVFSEVLLSQYADGAFRTAAAAAMGVDPDRLDVYAESGGVTGEYQAVLKRLDQICNATGATFVYIIRPDRTDYGHITFLFSTINRNSPYQLYEFGFVRETTNDDYRNKYQALYEEGSEQELVVGEGVILYQVLVDPIKRIIGETSRFARENVTTGTKLADTMEDHDEIWRLADSIDQMEEQIQHYVEDMTRIAAEQEKARTEMALAARIQENMLPGVFPPFPDQNKFDIYASMTPARDVGGDFYYFFRLDEDHLCLFIADVSGKGIPAALFMMVTLSILASNARQGESPAQILESTNQQVCGANPEGMFLTVWLGILEISTGKLTAANAGHEYPLVKQPGGPFEILKDRHGFVIGGMEGTKYREYETFLRPGSRLFVYTDGVPEASNQDGQMFGMENLLAALNREPEAAPERLLANVRKDVDDFVGQAEQFDDLTMMCLEIREKPDGRAADAADTGKEQS